MICHLKSNHPKPSKNPKFSTSPKIPISIHPIEFIYPIDSDSNGVDLNLI